MTFLVEIYTFYYGIDGLDRLKSCRVRKSQDKGYLRRQHADIVDYRAHGSPGEWLGAHLAWRRSERYI